MEMFLEQALKQGKVPGVQMERVVAELLIVGTRQHEHAVRFQQLPCSAHRFQRIDVVIEANIRVVRARGVGIEDGINDQIEFFAGLLNVGPRVRPDWP